MTDSAETKTANELIGATIAGRYQVVSLISSGGAGDVYEVTHADLHKAFAAKVLRLGSSNDNAMKRLRREAQVLCKLDHPNLVKVHSLVLDQDLGLILIMDLLRGRSLRQIAGGQRLKVGLALRLAVDVCNGLEAAHTHGVLHRDVKPDNIIVVQEGCDSRAILIDFGLAKVEQEGQQLTQTSMYVGTPLYMSPEQCRGEQLDARSDIYSLGCVIYELLSGRAPFLAETPLEVMQQHLHDRAPALSETNPELLTASELNRIVAKALQKHPTDRYQTVAELRHDLEEYRAKPFVATPGLVEQARLQNVLRTQAKRLAPWAVAGITCAGVMLVLNNFAQRELPSIGTTSQELRPDVSFGNLYNQFTAAEFHHNNAEAVRLAKVILEKRKSISEGRPSETAAGEFARAGATYWHSGLLDEAEEAYDEAIRQFRAVDKVPQLNLFDESVLVAGMRKYKKAELLCAESIPTHGLPEVKADRSLFLADLYTHDHREVEARKLLNALNPAELNDRRRDSLNLAIATTYFHQHKYNDAISWIEKVNSAKWTAATNAQAAVCYTKRGQPDLAEKALKVAIATISRTGDPGQSPVYRTNVKQNSDLVRQYLQDGNLLPDKNAR